MPRTHARSHLARKCGCMHACIACMATAGWLTHAWIAMNIYIRDDADYIRYVDVYDATVHFFSDSASYIYTAIAVHLMSVVWFSTSLVLIYVRTYVHTIRACDCRQAGMHATQAAAPCQLRNNESKQSKTECVSSLCMQVHDQADIYIYIYISCNHNRSLRQPLPPGK